MEEERRREVQSNREIILLLHFLQIFVVFLLNFCDSLLVSLNVLKLSMKPILLQFLPDAKLTPDHPRAGWMSLITRPPACAPPPKKTETVNCNDISSLSFLSTQSKLITLLLDLW